MGTMKCIANDDEAVEMLGIAVAVPHRHIMSDSSNQTTFSSWATEAQFHILLKEMNSAPTEEYSPQHSSSDTKNNPLWHLTYFLLSANVAEVCRHFCEQDYMTTVIAGYMPVVVICSWVELRAWLPLSPVLEVNIMAGYHCPSCTASRNKWSWVAHPSSSQFSNAPCGVE